jgi:photosystem II stability/assembly factor-like uncharacterized protein
MGDYLKEVEDQLVELTRQGAHRRPRPRLDLLAVGAAVAVVAAVAIVVSTIGGNSHRSSNASNRATAGQVVATPTQRTRTVTVRGGTPAGRPPVGTAVPHGFGPESFTAISELTWWLLGSAPCASPPCTAIVRTTDGGRTFVAVPAPRAPGFGYVSQLRFANSQDGFAFGPELWVTHDGGAHWTQWAIGKVTGLAISGGYAYAIVTNPSTGAGQLYRQPVGGDFWQPLPAAGDASSGLWVQGSEVLVESATRSAQQLRVSHDDGASFTAYPVPPSVACQFESPAPPVVWAHCATGMMSGTWRSTQGGQSFARVDQGLPELPNSAAFGSASATTAVVGYQALYRTSDGGTSWTKVFGPTGISAWQYIGFTDPTHGVAIGYAGTEQASNERLFYTTDGGVSYHLVTIR